MATVTLKKLIRPLMVAGIAAVIVGCPMDLALKTTIKGLAAPPNVSSLKVTKGASNQFILRWVDPSDKDVDHIEIDFKTPLSSNQPPTPVTVATGVQTATVTVPFNNVQYILTVKSVDKAGNKSPGAIYSPMSFYTAVDSALGSPVPILPTTSAPPKTEFVYYSPNTPPISPYSETINTYDASGNLTRQDYQYPVGTLYSYYTYVYDGKGNMTKQNFYYQNSGTPYLYSYYAYTYDSNNNQTTAYYYSGGSTSTSPSLSSFDQYQYDTNGNQIQDTYFDSTGTEQSNLTYQYDSNNRLIGGGYYSAGVLQYNIVATWDPNTGYPSKLGIYDPSNNPYIVLTWSISGTVLNQGLYANLGTPTTATETWTFDAHGLLNRVDETFSTGSYNYQFSYDSSGNLTTQLDNTNSGGTYYEGFTWTY